MQRQAVQLRIQQTIQYALSDHSDDWQWEHGGEWISLPSYHKISYQNEAQERITLKWSSERAEDTLRLELRQPRVTFHFVPGQVTQAFYQTEQGMWQLDVTTDRLVIEPVADGLQLHLKYRLDRDGESLGEYDFQLHCQPNVPIIER